MRVIMSEAVPTGIDTLEFPGLESLQMDPEIKATLDLMLIYNELLLDRPVSSEELTAIVNLLDDRWRNLINSKAIFTGRALFPNPFDQKRTKQEGYFEDEVVIFGGVSVGKIDAPQTTIKLGPDEAFCELRVVFQRECIDHRGEVVYLTGHAQAEEVASLEFPSAMSFDRSWWILEELQHDLREDIDIAIYADTDDECVRALNLGGLEYSLIGDEEIDNLMKGALDRYTNTLLLFDKRNGYDFKLEGRAWMLDESGEFVPSKVEGQSLAEVQGVAWAEKPGDSTILVPQLCLVVCPDTIQEDAEFIHLRAPIDTLKQLRSLRRLYYAENPLESDLR
jgi:hypothetical protein